jgi:peptidoglycan-associated lipoprotein
MKNCFLLAFSLLIFVGCSTAQPTTAATPPVASAPPTAAPAKPAEFVAWDKKMIDLGKVTKGEKRTMFFELTNVSGEVAKIEIVDACECTRVDFPRGDIAPGAKARLDVTFDSTEKTTGETIGINVVFTNVRPDGNPRIEVVEYKFEIQ